MSLRMFKRQPPKLLAQFLVSLLWGIVPLSWVYVILYVGVRMAHERRTGVLLRMLLHGTMPKEVLLRPWLANFLRKRFAFFWASLEVCFSIYYRHLVHRIQGRRRTSSPNSHTRIIRALGMSVVDGLDDDSLLANPRDTQKFPKLKETLARDDPRAIAFRKEMGGWFLGIRPEDITRLDVLNWLAWSIFDKYYDEVVLFDSPKHEMQLFLLDVLHTFEQRRGLRFPDRAVLSPIEEKRRRTMMLTLDPVDVHTRPLLLYILIFGLNRAVHAVLNMYGMRRMRMHGITYLLYMPPGWSVEAACKGEALRPVMFLHGLGLGLSEYVLPLFTMLRPNGVPASYPILVPLQPWISYEFFSPRFLRPWQHEEAANVVRSILELHQFDKCKVHVLSHSMGTIVHTWLLRTWSSLIARSVFVDPVCFQLWEPHICYRFLYKPTESFIEFVLRYFVARELGNANLLMRYFDWTANVLVCDDIPEHHDPKHVRVYLAGADTVLNAWRVQHLLKRSGMQDVIHYDANLHHGELIMAPGHRVKEMLDMLHAL